MRCVRLTRVHPYLGMSPEHNTRAEQLTFCHRVSTAVYRVADTPNQVDVVV